MLILIKNINPLKKLSQITEGATETICREFYAIDKETIYMLMSVRGGKTCSCRVMKSANSVTLVSAQENQFEFLPEEYFLTEETAVVESNVLTNAVNVVPRHFYKSTKFVANFETFICDYEIKTECLSNRVICTPRYKGFKINLKPERWLKFSEYNANKNLKTMNKYFSNYYNFENECEFLRKTSRLVSSLILRKSNMLINRGEYYYAESEGDAQFLCQVTKITHKANHPASIELIEYEKCKDSENPKKVQIGSAKIVEGSFFEERKFKRCIILNSNSTLKPLYYKKSRIFYSDSISIETDNNYHRLDKILCFKNVVESSAIEKIRFVINHPPQAHNLAAVSSHITDKHPDIFKKFGNLHQINFPNVPSLSTLTNLPAASKKRSSNFSV